MILAIDSMNHSEQPPVYLNYMNRKENNIDSEYVIGLEEGINVQILFQNPNYTNLNFKYFPTSELPYEVPSFFREAAYGY